MYHLKRAWWRLPGSVRKPVVSLVGGTFIIAAGLTGWLPGPGGIPLFLIGIAILATEFSWAERLSDWLLARLRLGFSWLQHHHAAGLNVLVILLAVLAGSAALYLLPKL